MTVAREVELTLSAVRQISVQLTDAAARRGATNLRIFGSVARGEATPSSDLDVLVDLEPGWSLVVSVDCSHGPLRAPRCRGRRRDRGWAQAPCPRPGSGRSRTTVRGDEDRVLDITEVCDQPMAHVGADHDRFEADPVIQVAAQRWLQIIGEAAARLSEEFRAEHPDVAWRDLVGMRNIRAHGYFHVDHGIMSTAITRDVPKLRSALQSSSEG